MVNFLKTAWKRITASKVAWMVIPTAIAQIILAFSGNDLSVEITKYATFAWIVIEFFLTVNNPADQTKL